MPQPKKPAARNVGYARISDDRTGENASVQRQKRKVEAYAASFGETIEEWYEDKDKSASDPHVVRKDYERMLTDAQLGAVGTVWSLTDDRVYRGTDEVPRLARIFAPRTIVIRCAESSDLDLSQSEGQMSAEIRGAVSGHESRRKRERVVLAAEDRARKGRFSGGVRRFGYTQSGTRVVREWDESMTHVIETTAPSGALVLVPEEAEAIAAGYAMILAGDSLNAVTRDWRSRGLTGVKGGPLTPMVVRDVLLRPGNAGLSAYRGEIVGTAEWPKIVDPDDWARVKAILEDPSRRTNVGRPATHLLSGILRCGTCGGPMRAASKAGGRQEYRCSAGRTLPDRTPGQPHSSRGRIKLDDAVIQAVLSHVQAEAASLIVPSKSPSHGVSKAVQEAAGLRDKIEAFQAVAADYDPKDLAGILRGLRGKLAEAEKKIVKESGRPSTHALLDGGDVWKNWGHLDTAQRRAVIKENVVAITVGPGQPGLRGDPMHNITIVYR